MQKFDLQYFWQQFFDLSALTTVFLGLQTFTSIFKKFLQAKDFFLIALPFTYCMFNNFLSFSEGAKLRQKWTN